MKIKYLATAFMAASLFSVGFANAQSVEPTESEMKETVVAKLQSLMSDDKATVSAISFKKDGCEAAKEKETAYICTFTAAMDIKVENTPEGNKTPITAKGLFEKNADGAWEVTPM